MASLTVVDVNQPERMQALSLKGNFYQRGNQRIIKQNVLDLVIINFLSANDYGKHIFRGLLASELSLAQKKIHDAHINRRLMEIEQYRADLERCKTDLVKMMLSNRIRQFQQELAVFPPTITQAPLFVSDTARGVFEKLVFKRFKNKIHHVRNSLFPNESGRGLRLAPQQFHLLSKRILKLTY